MCVNLGSSFTEPVQACWSSLTIELSIEDDGAQDRAQDETHGRWPWGSVPGDTPEREV